MYCILLVWIRRIPPWHACSAPSYQKNANTCFHWSFHNLHIERTCHQAIECYIRLENILWPELCDLNGFWWHYIETIIPKLLQRFITWKQNPRASRLSNPFNVQMNHLHLRRKCIRLRQRTSKDVKSILCSHDRLESELASPKPMAHLDLELPPSATLIRISSTAFELDRVAAWRAV